MTLNYWRWNKKVCINLLMPSIIWYICCVLAVKRHLGLAQDRFTKIQNKISCVTIKMFACDWIQCIAIVVTINQRIKISLLICFWFIAMWVSVLLVVIDMEYVISFIKSEISRGEGGGYRGPGQGLRLGCLQTKQLQFSSHTLQIQTYIWKGQKWRYSLFFVGHIHAENVCILRILSCNCVDDKS